jgi:threonine dehydratase
VLSGGNVDPRLAASIMVRELARAQRIVSIRLIIPDRPGVLADIAKTIGDRNGNVLEVLHQRTLLSVPAKGVSIDISIETHGAQHAAEIVSALEDRGYAVSRLAGPEPEQ